MSGWEWVWMSGIDLTQFGRQKVEGASGQGCIDETQGGQRVRECIARMRVGSGWSQRVWGWGKRCLGMVLMTQEWHRQVGIEQTGVGSVMVMTCTVLAC